MSNADITKLCMRLIQADSEQGVIDILASAGYWENTDLWRYYGDYENNYNTIGNQQSSSDAALVEKIINSVDARLMNECFARGLNADSDDAPKSIHEAVSVFIKGGKPGAGAFSGRLTEWTATERTEAARDITVSATGFKPNEGRPCLTISDCGEGQTPDMMPDTFLSLTKSNKLRIPFVQGKFNMGGTGVLKFCGRSNLQLIVTRRNPKLVTSDKPSDQQWSFTIVRRESPTGNIRNSVYTYLAPIDADSTQRCGRVLRFTASSLPIFPEANKAYSRDSEWGTLIKLYEYDVAGSKTHILRKGGLLSRLDLLMPEVALPVRLHECREGYRGHVGSFDTTLTGLRVRLEDDKADNLEEGRPWASPLTIQGEKIMATIYAFKRGRSVAYKRTEGILFTINGQTHGHIRNDFYRRKSVGLSYLADSLLVVLDCTAFTGRSREDLFMNSRDRLSNVELRREIERELAHTLKQHEGLRALKEKRRREEIEDRIGDEKPLEEVLRSLLKNAPILYQLFMPGARISNPFKKKKVTRDDKPYEGGRFPTYFRFKGMEYGVHLKKDCPIDRRCRVVFETDVENDYFDRQFDRGKFTLSLESNGRQSEISSYTLNLHNGAASLSLTIPDNCDIGDEFDLVALTDDPSQVVPFQNCLTVRVLDVAGPQTSGNGGTRKPRTNKDGLDDDAPSGISLPNITRVFEEAVNGSKGWQDMDPVFDKFTALRIRNAGTVGDGENGNGKEVFDFSVNMDNVFLNAELKSTKMEPELVRARFMYGMVLVGLGLLQQDARDKKSESGEDTACDNENGDIERSVETVSKALAPILLPMVNTLGALDEGSIEVGTEVE